MTRLYCISLLLHSWLNSFIFLYISLSYITWIIAAAHLHLSIINAKDPATGIPHVCGGLHRNYIISARPRDVEIAPPVSGIKTCLGREHRGGTVLSETSKFPSKMKITQWHHIDNINLHLRVFQYCVFIILFCVFIVLHLSHTVLYCCIWSCTLLRVTMILI